MYHRIQIPKQAFGFRKPKKELITLKKSYVPRRKPPVKPVTISEKDLNAIDLEMVQEFINEDWKCAHTNNGTNFYTFSYCKEGIMIEFSKEDCEGQGIVYLNKEDYSVNDVDVIVPCSLVAEDEEVEEIVLV